MDRSCASANAQLALNVSKSEGTYGDCRPVALATETTQQKIEVKTAVNEWMSANLGRIRTNLSLGKPSQTQHRLPRWVVPLVVKRGRHVHAVGEIRLDDRLNVIEAPGCEAIEEKVRLVQNHQGRHDELTVRQSLDQFGLFYGDGVAGAAEMKDRSVDLLLTDPPYSISPYTCEKQIPRRLRTDGGDFIMPKGNFGSWDKDFNPIDWTRACSH